MNNKKYVCGFCFNLEETKVALIEKKRPSWQKGLLNGIGGKIEINEYRDSAMRREFLEETGLEINDWKLFCTYQGPGYFVYFYKSFSDKLDKIKTMTDEIVSVFDLNSLNDLTIPNLKWLIPLALDSNELLNYCLENKI